MGLIGKTGTPESMWQAWPVLQHLRRWPLPEESGRAVVVAPHPDDETLGAAGLMSTLVGAGWELEVLLVTAGEASHPASATMAPCELAGRRLAESRAALSALGLADIDLACLELPDGRVPEHESELVGELDSHLAGANLVCSPPDFDGHCDHEATARAVAKAAPPTATVLGFPIWTWQWALPYDDRVPWHRCQRLDLAEDQREAKRQAIACHRTQVAPVGPCAADASVVTEEMVAHFLRPFEVLVVP